MIMTGIRKYLFDRRIILCFLSLTVTACGQLISNAKQQFADDLSATLLEQNDPVMVKQAIPAYLIMVSSMVRGDPGNAALLISASRLYGAYASAFSQEDKESRLKLATTAFEYAGRAFCARLPDVCGLQALPFERFQERLNTIDVEDVDVLFALGSAWAGWLQANSTDWNAVAELPKIQAIIERVIALDAGIDNGDAHLYLAVIRSLLPPAMGGKPETARAEFEAAIRVSKGSNLMAKVLYAERYARMVFDQDLHDRLLREVMAAEETRDAHTLTNAIAKQKARRLLAESPEYF